MNSEFWSSRRLAAEILNTWAVKDIPVDRVRDDYFQNAKHLDNRDRALVTEIVYGTVRQCTVIDKHLSKLVTHDLEKMQPDLLAILRSGLYQILFLDRIPHHAAVAESVEICKVMVGAGQSGLVNAVLRRAARELGDNTQDRSVEAFYIPPNPYWQWKNKWVDNWGEDKTQELLKTFTRIPPVGLRRNRLKTANDEEWLEILDKEGVKADLIPSWSGYVYTRGIRPDTLPSFEKGITTSQDPAAGIAPHVLDPQPGENILDLCCAPGGKTALIWELMQGKGTLLGLDKSLKRNRITRKGLKRLGHGDISIETGDALIWRERTFDRVLVDVPCGGTGVAHRRPDLLLKRAPRHLGQLVKMQRSLLNHAASLVKEGGILVYSTCSMEPEENERIVSGFNKRNSELFEPDAIPDIIPRDWVKDKSTVATWPPTSGVDGAFVARWRKIG